MTLCHFLDGQLACDQGGAEVVAVCEDLEDIATLFVGQVGQPPVDDDEQVDWGIGAAPTPRPSVLPVRARTAPPPQRFYLLAALDVLGNRTALNNPASHHRRETP